MKVLVIPDVHEKTCWKKRLQDNDWDKVIFLGDYVDSWTHNDETCISNLRDIIEFKKAMGDNCILLLGNHDVQYMFAPLYQCSGYQASIAIVLKLTFQENKDLFKIAHLENNYLFTHAGVSNSWYKKYSQYLENIPGTIDEQLNALFNSSKIDFIMEVGEIRGGFRNDVGGPIWADKSETMDDSIPNYHQIVGHTKVKDIIVISHEPNTSITYTDVLDTKEEYLLLDI